MNVRAVQHLLNQIGHPAGPVDGIAGPKTRSAISAFQRRMQLPETGHLDATTLGLLRKIARAPAAEPAAPAWYQAAEALQGIMELAGPQSNPTILGWARRLGGWIADWYRDDDTPWCGLFVAHCVSSTLPSEPLPSNPLAAREWLKFGVLLDAPSLGAILVFSRSGGGHVGFYVGEDSEALHVLGGNQSNAVNVTRISKNRLLGIRWPSSVKKPTEGRIAREAGTGISTNEV